MIRPKNETEVLLLSITKNGETLIKQTHTQPEETLEFKMIRPTFHFNIPILIEGDWMLGLTILEVNNSIFNIIEENNKFELYTDDSDDEFLFIDLKDKVAEVLGFSDISLEDLQLEIHGSKIIKPSMEKSQTDG